MCLRIFYVVIWTLIGSLNGNEEQMLSQDSLINSENVRAAIKIFLQEYERQHQAVVLRYELFKGSQIFEGPYYSSGILRLNFEFGKDNRTLSSSVLLKIPDLGSLHNYATKMMYYAKEKYMYEEVFPLMYENVPYEKPSPTFYGATDSGILVLENLRESGYRGKPKGTLVDFTTCKAAWKSLAQFHALSTLQLDRVSERIDSLTIMDRTDSEWIAKIFPPIARKLREHVLPSCSESAIIKLNHLIDNVPAAVNLGYFPNENGFDVLLHGDPHIFNVLFLEDEGNDIKLKFVDFQASRRGSPIIDLMYFSIISIPFEVFDEHRRDLFDIYVEEFNSVLKTMGVRNESAYYSAKHMETDFEQHKPFFFFIVCSAGPTLWTGSQKVSSLSGEETGLDVFLRSEKFISAFNGWTKHFM